MPLGVQRMKTMLDECGGVEERLALVYDRLLYRHMLLQVVKPDYCNCSGYPFLASRVYFFNLIQSPCFPLFLSINLRVCTEMCDIRIYDSFCFLYNIMLISNF